MRTLPSGWVRGALGGLALLCCGVWAGAAQATPALLLEQDRGIFARASAAEAGEFDEEVGPGEAADFGPYQDSVAVQAGTDAAAASGSASLVSDLDGSVISASGNVTCASAAGVDARAEAPADSFFEVAFEAAASEPARLAGSVAASADSGDGYASVRLLEAEGGAVLASYRSSPGQSQDFEWLGALQAGTAYRLTAFAVARAVSDDDSADASGGGSFAVTLTLPEPSRGSGIPAVLASLAALARLRRARTVERGR